MTWKLFDVTVSGFPPMPYHEASRGKALAAAFRSYMSYDPQITFSAFLKIARARLRTAPLDDDGYGYVRRNYRVDPKVGAECRLVGIDGQPGGRGMVLYPNRISTAHVHVVEHGRDQRLIVHPSNVRMLPLSTETLTPAMEDILGRAAGGASFRCDDPDDPGADELTALYRAGLLADFDLGNLKITAAGRARLKSEAA